MEHMPWTAEECTKVMLQTSDYIKLVSFFDDFSLLSLVDESCLLNKRKTN